MQTDHMTAGREMDAMVATQIMGWHEAPDGYGEYNWWSDGNGYREKVCCFKPSSNMNYAMLVVEKMREKGFAHTLTSNLQGGNVSMFLEVNKSKHIQSDIYTTAPFAICRAALAAVEGRSSFPS